MKIEEAKFILHAYRPNGADAGDPTFDEALALARRDPVMSSWLERLQAFDRTMAGKLASIPPPPDLRDAIVAGARVSSSRAPGRARRWGHPAWLALAAGIVVAGAVMFTFAPSRAEASALDEFVAADARRLHSHGQGGAAGSMASALARADVRLGARLPVDFNALRESGCRSIRFKGVEVLEVCFLRDGEWFHCYVARRGDFPDLHADAVPAISERRRVHLATWADEAHVFVVVSKAGREALQRLI